MELLHDVHERIPPIQAIGLAKELEQYHLFFLEDLLAPEDNDYFRIVRQQTSTPLAMGELFVNQAEYVPLIRERLIDFIRVHISDIGGLSMARKLAALCEFFGVRTAWHGPGTCRRSDTRPICSWTSPATISASRSSTSSASVRARSFQAVPEIRDGALWSNDQPGLGIDVDEKLAARYPFPEHPLNGAWPAVRRIDGTVIRP